MESLFHYVAPPSTCGYLPEQLWSLEYERVLELSAEEYSRRLLNNWRRFGGVMFRPRCQNCTACLSLRVDVAAFRPNRSQRRCQRDNIDIISLTIARPTATREKLKLYDRFHAFQSIHKGWTEHPTGDVIHYRDSYVNNPPFTEEWSFRCDRQLVGVGYVDRLPIGLSAIYFFYDPDYRDYALGTWNVLSLIDNARRAGLPHVYLGYFVAGCSSLEYKANFQPNQIREPDGRWRDFR